MTNSDAREIKERRHSDLMWLQYATGFSEGYAKCLYEMYAKKIPDGDTDKIIRRTVAFPVP